MQPEIGLEQFQFYLSSIKSIIGVCLKRGIFKFQFYLSSIKSR